MRCSPEGVGRDLEEPLRLSEELRHHREDAVVLATRRREQLVGDLGLHGEDDLVDLLERAEQLEEELARQVEGGVGQHREGPSPLRRESRQVEPEPAQGGRGLAAGLARGRWHRGATHRSACRSSSAGRSARRISTIR